MIPTTTIGERILVACLLTKDKHEQVGMNEATVPLPVNREYIHRTGKKGEARK
jgi:hypothetical protein